MSGRERGLPGRENLAGLARPGYAQEQVRVGINVMQAFPSAFAFCCVLMFAAPMGSLIHLHFNMNVRYWVGWWCALAIVPLFVFIAAYGVHIYTRQPNKTAVLASVVVPSALYILIGLLVWAGAREKASHLANIDCSAFESKLQLEHSWKAAHGLFTACMQATAASNPNITVAQGEAMYRIWQCQGYEAGLEANGNDWEYLAEVEEKFACSGWCTAERPLWTAKDTLDSCSASVGQDLNAVATVGREVLVLSTLLLAFFSACLLVVGPRLRAKGYDW